MEKTAKLFQEAWLKLDESVRVRYERNRKTGKIEKKFFTPRQGYRIKYKNGKPVEVYMSPIERKHRSEAARKSASKRKKRISGRSSSMSISKRKVGKKIN